jgi:hypothetical protein
MEVIDLNPATGRVGVSTAKIAIPAANNGDERGRKSPEPQIAGADTAVEPFLMVFGIAALCC